MIQNYLRTALRIFRKHPLFSAINIFGLAIGISASLVIFLIVRHDLSFDQFEEDRDRIYRVVTVFTFGENEYPSSGVTIPMGDALRSEMTGLDLVVPFLRWSDDVKLSVPTEANNKFNIFKNEPDIIFADRDYFKLIHYKWLGGSPETALSEPYQTVITEKNAARFFPGMNINDIIGKEIIFNDTVRMTITGIVANLSAKTDFNFQIFNSRATLEKTSLKPYDWTSWNNTNSSSQLFVKLAKGSDPSAMEKRIGKLYVSHNPPEPNDPSKAVHSLQPLSDIHFNSKFDNFDQRQAHLPTIYGLMALAGFLLVLGCINFINLTTAQASQRAREIGIRKTLGSSRRQLIFQFLGETFFHTLLATVVSILITPLLLNAFADFVPADLQYTFGNVDILLFLVIIIFSVSFLSGIYPSLILSSLLPISTLKNQITPLGGNKGRLLFRKSLTVSQFVIAQVFIIATIIVGKQIRYTLDKDLGYKKDAIVYFQAHYKDPSISKRKLLAEKIKGIPGVAAVSLSNFVPTTSGGWSTTLEYNDGKSGIITDVIMKAADTNYIPLYQFKLIAGTNIPLSDTIKSFVINETYAKVLGFKNPHEAIGKQLDFNRRKLDIAGVIADYNQKSLHEKISPLAIVSSSNLQRTFNVSLQPRDASGNNWKNAIAKMEKSWKEVYPDDEFDLKFLDETIAKYYTAEKNISRLLTWATGLAIVISCLGLLGLVIYTTNQKVKEIGIRKVVGASITQIVTLLSADFLKLVLIAFIMAVPLAWWGASRWLENFAFRINISAGLFFLGGLIMLMPALIILFLRTYKAANTNPVESLRNE